MKRFLISIPILIITVTIVTLLEGSSYSNYKKGMNVNINNKTGKLLCDATLDNPGNYVSADGWAYFKITAVNYDSNNVSDVPVEFNLNIRNATGSSATYRVSTGSDVGTFGNNITTSNYQFEANTRQSRDFIIEVKTNSQNAEDIDFNVDFNCYQVAN